jgi:hypothetical protein
MDIIYLHYNYMNHWPISSNSEINEVVSEYQIDHLVLEKLSAEAILHFSPNYEGVISFSHEYENIQYKEGYEKPSREAFEAKLQELIDAKPWKEIREERNKRISVCDWTQLPNAPLSGAKKYEWETYRQALRDITQTTEDPSNPVWPIQPSP